MNISNRIIRLLFFSTTLALLAPNAWSKVPEGFFFFGDSLSDSGYQNNNPLVKRLGKTPQWTSPKGHTWVYYFLQDYADYSPNIDTTLMPNNVDAASLYNPVPTHILPILDGNNFATGGSTTGSAGILNSDAYKAPSLLEQIDYFVRTYAPKHAIAISENEYLIWSGNNDLMKKLAFEMWVEHVLQKLYLSQLAAALD